MSETADFRPTKAGLKILTVDERADWIREGERDIPGKGMHRIQQVIVRRGQYLCTFLKDLGPAFLFPGAPPMQQAWLAGEYSVGEAMEIAHQMRENKPPEEREPTDLMGEYRKELDEKRAARAHRTTSGPHLTIERR